MNTDVQILAFNTNGKRNLVKFVRKNSTERNFVNVLWETNYVCAYEDDMDSYLHMWGWMDKVQAQIEWNDMIIIEL